MEILTHDTVDMLLDYALDYNDASEYVKNTIKYDEAIRERLIEIISCYRPDLIVAKSRIAEAAEAVITEACENKQMEGLRYGYSSRR